MSRNVRRAGGVLIALAVLAAAAVWGQVHATRLNAQAADEARQQAEDSLRLAAMAFKDVPVKAVEQAQLLTKVPGLVGESGIITAALRNPDTSRPALAETLNDALENEPWTKAWRNSGAIAIYFGAELVFPAEGVPYAQAIADLRTEAEGRGTSMGVITFDGIGILVGMARAALTGPRQESVIFGLTAPLDSAALAPVAQAAGATVAFHVGETTVQAGDPVLATMMLELERRPPQDRSDPCCAFTSVGGGTLGVYRDPSMIVSRAANQGVRDRVLSLLAAGVIAVLALVFLTFRRGAKEQELLLKETTAELKRSREELHRLSQRLSAPGMATPGVATPGGVPQVEDDGLGRTSASISTSGRYEVVAPLGEGGMARVYVAQVKGAEGFRRLFVVKRLRAELAGNQELVNQFIDEARLGASLVHSNVVPVFDFGRDAEGYFLAQEFILGRDVDTVIQTSKAKRGRPLEPAIVSYIGVEALKALGYAHTLADGSGQQLGLVHRDVSPNNLMVSHRGEVKLLDFGIVKSQGRVTKTQTGIVKGNLFFMSPEQAQALELDHRSDLFSLAQCLFTAVTGETMYSGTTSYELLIRAGAGPTAADREKVAALPRGLGPVLLKALETDPSRRFPTAEAFAQALAAASPPASSSELHALMQSLLGEELAADGQRLAMRADA